MAFVTDSFLYELKTEGDFEKYLQPVHDSRDSFYKKAKIYTYKNFIYLVSYETIVAYIEKTENNEEFAIVLGYYSSTTSRHINEFLKQYGFIYKNIPKKDYDNTDVLMFKKGVKSLCN